MMKELDDALKCRYPENRRKISLVTDNELVIIKETRIPYTDTKHSTREWMRAVKRRAPNLIIALFRGEWLFGIF
jgi:hypothetical protein